MGTQEARREHKMSSFRITLLSSQNRELREWFCGHPQGHERGAIILFRRLARNVENQSQSDRFLAVDIIKMSDSWVLESSVTHLKINMRMLSEVYYRCESEGLELGFVHSHPNGSLGFSRQDDINEQNILHGLSGCNGKSVFLIAMVFSDDQWCARVRQGYDREKILQVRHISVLGDRINLHGVTVPQESPEILKRQEAAFGKPFNSMLKTLRVAVVGVGGTGSAVATLLARAGIGELILIDGDNLDKTNLNRVRGYRSEEVGRNKAESLSAFISSLGLEISVSAINKYLDKSSQAIDALSSADVVFGCTDDQAGRDLMNQALYYYAFVYIDLGLTGRVDNDSTGHAYLRDHRGRVSCILPEYGTCLRCQRVVTEQQLTYEEAIKRDPGLAKLDPLTLQREYYIIGGGEQAPGVGPFTSATADNAIATLMDLLRPYRMLSSDLRRDNIWIDFVHMCIHSNEPLNDPECIYCRKHSLLLKQEAKYRLDMPSLGKIE